MSLPAPTLKRIHHVELAVGNARQAEYYYRRAFGFSRIAYAGPETGVRDRASYVLRQGQIRLVLTTPLSSAHPLAEYIAAHGDAVYDIAFEVDDVAAAFAQATGRGAPAAVEPHTRSDGAGATGHAAIATFGGTLHSFHALNGYAGAFLPGFVADGRPGYDAGLKNIDHIVGNVEVGRMDEWASFYERVFGFSRFVSFDDKDISTEFSSLRSQVMASPSGHIKFPINEPAPGRRKSQIQEYIDFHGGAGAQHIAMRADDIVATVAALRENGVEFLGVPDTYYEQVWDRVGEIREDRQAVRNLGLLADRDDEGYLLQLFTRPVEDRPTLFYEIIQRAGSQSFGKGNFKALFESIEREQARRGNL